MKVTKVADFTSRNLTGKVLVAEGYSGACRYIKNAPVSGALDKEMRAAEVAEKSAAGCRLVANFEWGERPADTVSEGQRHAGVFLQWCQDVNAPDWAPCYFSLDSNNPDGSYHSYFTGVVRELGTPARAGVYGNGACYRSLLKADLVTLAWHSKSSSYAGNHDTTGANLVQRLATATVGGYTVDVNDAKTVYYGGWLLGEDDPMSLTAQQVWDEQIQNNVLGADGKPIGPVPARVFLTSLNSQSDQNTKAIAELQDKVAALPTTAVPSQPLSDADVKRIATQLAGQLRGTL